MSNLSEPQIDEQLLLVNIQAGDTESFGLIIGLYEKKISRYVKRFIANSDALDDVLQEIFIKAYVNINSFEARGSFSSWLYRIAHNEAINHIRKNKPAGVTLVDIETIESLIISDEESHTQSENSLTRELLNKLLSEIDYKYREALVLYYFEELSYKEISVVIRIPVSAVGVRISRGRDKLAELAKKKYIRQ